MKLAICDVCKCEEEFIDECPLVTQEICKKCNNPVKEFTFNDKPIITDKPIKVETITLGGNPSARFTKKYCNASGTGLTITDLDGVYRNFNTEEMIILEYKSMGKSPCIDNFSQWEIYRVLDRALRGYLGDKFKGAYVIWTDKYEMTDANIFKINGARANINDVIDLMNLEHIDYKSINFSDYNEYKRVNDIT